MCVYVCVCVPVVCVREEIVQGESRAWPPETVDKERQRLREERENFMREKRENL